MAKIDYLGLQNFPPKGILIDHNEGKRLAYMKGINDTLGELRKMLQKKVPDTLPELLDDVLKFMESYYEV